MFNLNESNRMLMSQNLMDMPIEMNDNNIRRAFKLC